MSERELKAAKHRIVMHLIECVCAVILCIVVARAPVVDQRDLDQLRAASETPADVLASLDRAAERAPRK